MFRRSALPAVAALAVVLLAATGCRIQVSGAAPAAGAVPAGTSGVTRPWRTRWSKAAERGVGVQVCGENEGGEYDRAYQKLARAGVRISYYSSSAGFYIHGKVVEADYGTARAEVFIGSENFSSTSLNQNRELGLIISSHPVMSAIVSTFAADFRNGKRWS